MTRRRYRCWACSTIVPGDHRRNGGQCDVNKKINNIVDVGLVGVPKNTLSVIKQNNIHFVEQVIKIRDRGKVKETGIFIESSAALLCGNFKGKCLRFLLKSYQTDEGFRAHYTNLLTKSHTEAYAFCLEEYLYSKDVSINKETLLGMLPVLLEDYRRLKNALKKAIPVKRQVKGPLPAYMGPVSGGTEVLDHYNNVDADSLRLLTNHIINLISKIELEARRQR